MLICPVRSCGLPLERTTGQVRCERGHSFDIARSGYINLLQPQDRRSRKPGDTLEAVQARRRLHDLGVTKPLLESIADLLPAIESILDAGCGDGFYLGGLTERNGHGIDISTAAIDAAARRYPANQWVIANADRFLPYADRSFTTVISITGRRNPSEFHRILQNEGRLLIAIPAPDDLIELRGPEARDRVPATLNEFAGRFQLENQTRATAAADLSADSVRDILHSVYRPLSSEQPRAMRITFSLDLLLFRPLTEPAPES